MYWRLSGLLLLLSFINVKGQIPVRDGHFQSPLSIAFRKCSNTLLRQLDSLNPDQLIKVEFLVHDLQKLKAICDQQGFSIINQRILGEKEYLVCQLTKKQFLFVIEYNDVITAEYVRSPEVELKQEGLDLSLNQFNLLHHARPEMSGTGLNLSIRENSFDTTDIDFIDRFFITSLTPASANLHATNMASITAGGNISDPTAKGVAWDATLTSASFDILLPDPDHYFEDYSISVQNHAYGTGIENYYGMETLAYDESCSRLTSLVHIFSSGNEGDQSPPDGIYAGLPGWANITGQFKQSKNTITVGATDSLANVVEFSSRGPAYDGRIKPEVVAYGHGGTSGSAALVSGLSILMQESFKKNHANAIPPSSLIKAILVNTARDVSRTGPDFESGFGSVRAVKAIKTIEENQFRIDEVQQEEINTYSVFIPVGTGEVRITIAWTDPASTLMSQHALVNDLDMRLKNILTGEVWFPWTLNTFPHPDSLASPAKRGIDTINNIEQITLVFPEPGEYEIQIDGNKLTSEVQEFSFTWQMEESSLFQWEFPTGSDQLVPDKKNIIRWDASGTEPGKIEYKSPGEMEWHLINENVDPSKKWINWIPSSPDGLMQLRWTDINATILSDTFVVGSPVRPKVGFQCTDSLLFYWENNTMADSFEILRLGSRHLEHFDFTSDTFYISHQLSDHRFHYSVVPMYDGRKGTQSYGFDYRTQGAGCYIKTFFLREILDGSAIFNAELGTLYNVVAIRLERLAGQQIIPVVNIIPDDELSFLLESDDLKQGINNFRLTVVLQDGTTTSSEIVTVYYSALQKVLVFPNPGFFGREINILVNSIENYSLTIVDMLGCEISTFGDISNPQTITVSGLAQGQYIVLVRYEGGGMDTQIFVVGQ